MTDYSTSFPPLPTLPELTLKIIRDALNEENSKEAPQRNDQRIARYLNLALKAIAQDTRNRKFDLDVEKFKTALNDKLQLTLQAIAEELKGNSRALAIYEQLKQELAKSA